MGKNITFEVTENIHWDNWGRLIVVFSQGQICEGTLHEDGTVTAESPYYETSLTMLI
ncbi:hypothetical protein MHB48_07000 [Psychrobacillus sp. FSL H8-0483]|uniref:hypothetical protein n=1 Tax=Psychrobacillus sp. FSL H8-0483 TaxID=2921389 RepID=UPI00315997DA